MKIKLAGLICVPSFVELFEDLLTFIVPRRLHLPERLLRVFTDVSSVQMLGLP